MPTVALELRLITELARQRPDRYTPIIQFMQVNGCDIELIHRGMEIARLPQALQEDVLNQLQRTSVIRNSILHRQSSGGARM